MEENKFKIDNTNFLTFDGRAESSARAVRITRGTAYLYAVKKLADGRTGARHEVAVFSEGDICPNVPPSEFYLFILAGTGDTEAEFIFPQGEELEKLSAHGMELSRTETERIQKEAALESERSVEQQKRSRDIFCGSLASISSVVNKESETSLIFGDEDTQLVKVFKIIGKRMGFAVKTIEGRKYDSTKAGVNLLAKDNTIRVREVALRSSWYKEDNGDLIAFYNPEKNIDLDGMGPDSSPGSGLKAVALLYRKNSYVLVDPEDNSHIPVTKEVVAKIHPMAFMAYRSITEEKITIRAICGFVFSHIKADILRYVLIGLLCTLIGLITPSITRHFIDEVIPQAAKNTALQICFVVFMTNIASLVGGMAKYYANLRMDTRADSDLQAAVTDRLLKLPVDFFKNYSAGDLSSRLLMVNTIQKKIFDIALGCFTNFIFSFVYLIQEFRYCGYFAKWGILFCFVPLLISICSSLLAFKWQKILLESQGKLQGLMLQILNGNEKINVSNSHRQIFNVWTREFIPQTRLGCKLLKIENVTSVITGVFPTLVSIMFYLLYGVAIQHKKIEGLTTGSFMAFLSAFSSFQGAFLGLANSLFSIKDIVPMYRRVKPLLEEKPEIDGYKPSIGHLNGDIEVSHVNFRYSKDAPLVLKDISMTVHPGEFVAVVGTSGAGKSTLLRMLLGFEKPESGSIYYDETDINSVDIGSLRRQMGVVLQNDTVMLGSILQNIVGSSGLKESDAWEAAKKVAFDKDIDQMPMGMLTMVPAGGGTLSGGQLQRLIIARAIIKNPNVLIFDEATSALDNITQEVVRKSLDELKITRIIIAHRLSTIINADRIYVMNHGEIVETGTYDSLMKAGGYFAQLAKRQSL